jgi:hypothetical protein
MSIGRARSIRGSDVVMLWLALVRCGGGHGAPGEGFSCDGLVLRQVKPLLVTIGSRLRISGFSSFRGFVVSVTLGEGEGQGACFLCV